MGNTVILMIMLDLMAYRNLKSVSKWDFNDELTAGKDEIVERYAEMLEDNSVSEYKHLFEEVDDEE